MVVNEGVPIENIVAITFTKKATAEMRNRIHSLVSQMLTDEEARQSVGFTIDDTLAKSRLEGLRRDLSNVQVSTFHAYCNGALRKHGHLIDIDPQSREIGVAESGQLLKEAIRATLRQHFHNPFQEVDVLSLYDSLDITNVETILENFITGIEYTGDELSWIDPMSAEELVAQRRMAIPDVIAPVLLQIVNKIIDDMISLNVFGSEPADTWFERLKRYRTLLNNSSVTPDTVKSVIESIKLLFTDKGTPRKKSKKFEGAESLSSLSIGWENRLTEIDFSNDASELEQARLLLILRRLSVEAYHRFVGEKRLRKGIDYSDMVSGVIKLLESRTEIRNEIQRSIRHLMVDEFQDTDLRQLHLITLLIPSLTNPASRVHSTLFIVGDPKQSIYGFRGADVGSFFRAESLIETSNSQRNLPSGLILLQQSYRTAPRLLQNIDRTCERIFLEVAELDRVNVPYDNLVAGRITEFDNDLGSLHIIDLDSTDTDAKEDDDPDNESVPGRFDIVGDYISSVLNGDFPAKVESRATNGTGLRIPKPSDIAVLTRTHVVAKDVALSLLHRGVPFRVYGGRDFYSRPEVADIRNLLLWVTDNADSLALTALLRSPILRLTDNELATVALSSPERTISMRALEACISNGKASTEIKRAFETLQLFTRKIQRFAPGEFVRRVHDFTEWHRTIAGDPRREQILSNVDKLITIIDDAYSMVGATLQDVVDAIRVPVSDVEGEGIVVSDGDCVQIMTIHQAKGLERPIVFLVVPESRKSHSSPYYSSEGIGPTFTLPQKKFVAAPQLTSVKCPPSASHIANRINADVTRLAESSRIMYVALTRAQDHAFVCTNDERLKNHLPPLDPTQPIATQTSYKRVSSDQMPLDYTLPVGSAMLESVSVTQLMQASADDVYAGTGEAVSSLEFGIAFHDAIASVIGTPNHNDVESAFAHIGTELDDELVTRIRNVLTSVMQSTAYREIPVTCQAEVPYSAIIEETVVQGRFDAVSVAEGIAHVWDWKTNTITKASDVERLVSEYSLQAKAYAWLCFSDVNIRTVNVTLMFVSAISVTPNWHSQLSFTRGDVPAIETELKNALQRLVHLTTINAFVEEKTPAAILA